MTKIAQNSVAKLSVAFVTVAMLFTLVAPAAKAQTASEDLAAQIANLMAQIAMLEAQLSGGSTGGGTCVAIQAPLTIGAQNADVTALQNFLINAGEVIPAGATGYFGSQTQAALASWQAANGVSPAVGYYGPITKAAIESACVPSVPTTPDNGDEDEDEDEDMDDDSNELGNDSGSIDNVDRVSPEESSINEGDMAGVLAFEVEIDGDLQLNRFDFYAEQTTSADSDNADDYFQTVSLWLDGDMIAEVDVDDLDEDDYDVLSDNSVDEFRIRFSGLDLVFEDGDKPEFELAFEANTSIDSNDLDTASWDVALDSIRTLDGQGFTTSEGSYASTIEETFTFDEEEAAEITVVESNDNPVATTIEVDADEDTDDVEVFVFEIEEENGVDVTINDMTINLLTSVEDVVDVVREVTIEVDGEELDTETVSGTASTSMTVDFDDLGLMVGADETVEVTVLLTFNDTNDGNAYTNGETIMVSVDAATDITDADDENGNDESDFNSGSGPEGDAESEVHTLRETGVNVVHVSDTTSVIENDDTTSADDEGKYVLKFKVEAFGDTLYLPFGSDRTATSSVGVTYEIINDSFAVVSTGTSTASLTNTSSSNRKTNSYRVSQGGEVELTLTTEFDPATSGSYALRIKSINYALTDSATATVSQDVSDQDIETDAELI